MHYFATYWLSGSRCVVDVQILSSALPVCSIIWIWNLGELFFPVFHSSASNRFTNMVTLLNSLFNPLLYCYRDRRFMTAFRELLGKSKPQVTQPAVDATKGGKDPFEYTEQQHSAALQGKCHSAFDNTRTRFCSREVQVCPDLRNMQQRHRRLGSAAILDHRGDKCNNLSWKRRALVPTHSNRIRQNKIEIFGSYYLNTCPLQIKGHISPLHSFSTLPCLFHALT